MTSRSDGVCGPRRGIFSTVQAWGSLLHTTKKTTDKSVSVTRGPVFGVITHNAAFDHLERLDSAQPATVSKHRLCGPSLTYGLNQEAIGRLNLNLYNSRGEVDGDNIESYRYRQSSSSSSSRHRLNRVPEEMETAAAGSSSGPGPEGLVEFPRYYGSVGNASTSKQNPADGVASPSHNDDDGFSDLSGEEEEERILDEELAIEGLYRGNYKNLLLLYTFVPFSTILTFVFLGLLPIFAFSSSSPSPFPYPPYLPFPLPEIFTAAALWTMSYLIRDSLFASSQYATSFIPFPFQRCQAIPLLTSIISAILQSTSTIVLRQLAVPILLIPYYSTERLGLPLPSSLGEQYHILSVQKHHFPTWQDGAFRRVWWVALGWAAAEAIVGIKQGYENVELYKDVLVTVKKSFPNKLSTIGAPEEVMNEGNSGPMNPAQPRVDKDASLTPTATKSVFLTVDDNINVNSTAAGKMALIARTFSNSPSTVSDFGGSGISGERLPLISSPTILTRQRTNESERKMAENEVERDLESLQELKNREELEELYGIPFIQIPVFISCLHRINSILSSLGISLLVTAAYMRSTWAYHPFTALEDVFQPSNRSLMFTLPPLIILQSLVALMHTLWILPRIGIHTFVYVGLLISLGLFFGGLGVWEALS